MLYQVIKCDSKDSHIYLEFLSIFRLNFYSIKLHDKVCKLQFEINFFFVCSISRSILKLDFFMGNSVFFSGFNEKF